MDLSPRFHLDINPIYPLRYEPSHISFHYQNVSPGAGRLIAYDRRLIKGSI
jgi:hypothetical protein